MKGKLAKIVLIYSLFLLLLLSITTANECKNGYSYSEYFHRCVQTSCEDGVRYSHYSSTGGCVCGSSGSMFEDENDPNKECYYPSDYESCPGCIYACLHKDEECPEKFAKKEPEPLDIDGVLTGDIKILSEKEIEEKKKKEEEQEWEDKTTNWLGELMDKLFPTKEEDKDNKDKELLEQLNAAWTKTATEEERNPYEITGQGIEGGKNISDEELKDIFRWPSLKDDNKQEEDEEKKDIQENNEDAKCKASCTKFYGHLEGAEILSSGMQNGKCECIVDIKDEKDRVMQSIKAVDEVVTTYTFDKRGKLLDKKVVDKVAEKEAVRKAQQNKYSEQEIDKLLKDEEIVDWFEEKMKGISTETKVWHPKFWWQHAKSLKDLGMEDNASFVYENGHGRCGESMNWLEQELQKKINLEDGKKEEAMISITGEKYGGMLNHVGLIIRPEGLSNEEWNDFVLELRAGATGDKKKTKGISVRDMKTMDERILKARVLDPYFKKTSTVEEFMEGWSYVLSS